MSVGDFYTLLLRDRLGVVVALLFCWVFMRESESERILLQKLFERDFLSARNCEIHLKLPCGSAVECWDYVLIDLLIDNWVKVQRSMNS